MLKKILGRILNHSEVFQAINYRRKIQKKHKFLEEKNLSAASKSRYYIIRYSDPQSSGWTVWERVVLYSCIYAEDHNLIPVVDMKNYKNIYQEKDDFKNVNVWEKYYLQPRGVGVETALKSGNYILSDPSQEWFNYIRKRRPKRLTEEFLRNKYSEYIKLRPEVINICEQRYTSIIPEGDTEKRLLAIRLRGTDYKMYHHAVQPEIKDIVKLAKAVFKEYKCDYYFVSTEDWEIFQMLKQELPEKKMITYNSGNVKSTEGYVGEYMSKMVGAHNASLDYIVTLYILNKYNCLIGGICGATIVAKYRRNPPYEYINIIDTNEHY